MILADLFDLTECMHSIKYLRSATLGCQDIGYRKSGVVLKTSLLFLKLIFQKTRKLNDLDVFDAVQKL